MYLNMLLKINLEPTFHSTFNGSTYIETKNKHIYRGFKEHNKLS